MTRLNSGGILAGGVRGGSHSVTSRDVAGETAPGVRAAKISEFVVSTLDGPICSKYSIALTYPAKSPFQHTLSKERWGQGWNECYGSSREEE